MLGFLIVSLVLNAVLIPWVWVERQLGNCARETIIDIEECLKRAQNARDDHARRLDVATIKLTRAKEAIEDESTQPMTTEQKALIDYDRALRKCLNVIEYDGDAHQRKLALNEALKVIERHKLLFDSFDGFEDGEPQE